MKTCIYRLGMAVVFFGMITKAEANPLALVYAGPGTCPEGCAKAASDSAIRAGFDTTFVTPDMSDAEFTQLFQKAKVWIHPGGKSTEAVNAMTDYLKKSLQTFIQQGGGYVGYCAGAFSATQIVGTSGVPGLNIFPGSTKLYSKAKGAKVLPIQWNGKIRKIYWEGGPVLNNLSGFANLEIIAKYPNKEIAAARGSYGSGRVFITGLHPESPDYWKTYYKLSDSDGNDWDLVAEMLIWASNI